MEKLLRRTAKLLPHVVILFPHQRITVDYPGSTQEEEKILIEGFINEIHQAVSDMKGETETYPGIRFSKWLMKVFHFQCGDNKIRKILLSIIMNKYNTGKER